MNVWLFNCHYISCLNFLVENIILSSFLTFNNTLYLHKLFILLTVKIYQNNNNNKYYQIIKGKDGYII